MEPSLEPMDIDATEKKGDVILSDIRGEVDGAIDDAGDSEMPLRRPAKRRRRESSVRMDELLAQYMAKENESKPIIAIPSAIPVEPSGADAALPLFIRHVPTPPYRTTLKTPPGSTFDTPLKIHHIPTTLVSHSIDILTVTPEEREEAEKLLVPCARDVPDWFHPSRASIVEARAFKHFKEFENAENVNLDLTKSVEMLPTHLRNAGDSVQSEALGGVGGRQVAQEGRIENAKHMEGKIEERNKGTKGNAMDIDEKETREEGTAPASGNATEVKEDMKEDSIKPKRRVFEYVEEGAAVRSYLTCRNILLIAYFARPRDELTVAKCCRLLGIPTSLVISLHHFLEFWGHINTSAIPSLPPATTSFAAITQSAPDISYSDATSPSESSWRSRRDIANLPLKMDEKKGNEEKSLVGSESGRTWSSSEKRVCAITQVPLDGLYYQCRTRPSLYLSPEAFARGLYPAFLSSVDFERVDSAEIQKEIIECEQEMWDLEETAALLEAVDREARGPTPDENESQISLTSPEFWFEVQWENVAEQVGGGRSARDCLLHFLRLPIEEILSEIDGKGEILAAKQGGSIYDSSEPPTLERRGEEKGDVTVEGDGKEVMKATVKEAFGEVKNEKRIAVELSSEPFSALGVFMSTPNPIMAMLAYLQQTLHVEIAAHAAQAAMRSFSNAYENYERMNNAEEQRRSEEFPTAENVAFAMSAALKAAAEKSHALAMRETEMIVRAAAKIIEVQNHVIQLKGKSYLDLTKILHDEKSKVERARRGMSTDLEKMEKVIHAVRMRIPEEKAKLETEAREKAAEETKVDQKEEKEATNDGENAMRESKEVAPAPVVEGKQSEVPETADGNEEENNEDNVDLMELEDLENEVVEELDGLGDSVDGGLKETEALADAAGTLPDGENVANALDLMDLDDGDKIPEFDLNDSAAGGLGEELAANADVDLPELLDINEDREEAQ